MNVNGSRFHMLLGRSDWGACRVPAGPVRRKLVSNFWPRADDPQDQAANAAVPYWNSKYAEVTLAPTDDHLSGAANDTALQPALRRACATDAAGNLYLLNDDARAIEIVAAVDAVAHPFWPDPRSDVASRADAFGDALPVVPFVPVYGALAVTGNGFLVAWWRSGSDAGADRFDLVAGGPPERISASAGIPGPVADLAARGPDGLWALLEVGGGLMRLDADLRPCAAAPAALLDDPFQPGDPAAPARRHPAPWQTAALPLPAGLTARQLLLGWGEVPLVLASKAAGGVALLAPDSALTTWQTVFEDARVWYLAATAQTVTGDQSIYLVQPSGNQASELLLRREADLSIHSDGLQPATYPLRRFGGRLLGQVGGQMRYDSGATPRFVPLVEQRHSSFAAGCRFETQIYDSGTEQCVWDRIRLDACIPAGTKVQIEARCGESEDDVIRAGESGWQAQPLPYLSGDGGELPGKRSIAQLPTDLAHRRGCWDLLLQRQSGRFCQLRITLSGSGQTTPRLRALRLWYPRFAYPERFLPALYRAEPASADLLERFLANMEGVNTAIEDRIATAQALLDPRTVPEGMLGWLASWLDLMLDPAWTADRKRLFLANAVRFFGWRGTVPGLQLALRIAFDADVTSADFTLGGTACHCPGQVRIVESFSTHLRGRKFSPPAQLGGTPVSADLAAAWQPQEGSPGLWQRFAAAGGTALGGAFPLFAPDAAEADIWAAVCQAAFGFVPAAGAEERAAWQASLTAAGLPLAELPVGQPPSRTAGDVWAQFTALPRLNRQRWQDFLQRRYARIARLNQAWLSVWASFAEIPLPAQLSGSAGVLQDWLQFEGELLPRTRNAHRFIVLLPVHTVSEGSVELADRMALAKRIVATEKPAQTEFDVRFYWAMNRVGEARLGEDTALGAGSRAPELIPPALLGASYIGSSFVGGPPDAPAGRARLAC